MPFGGERGSLQRQVSPGSALGTSVQRELLDTTGEAISSGSDTACPSHRPLTMIRTGDEAVASGGEKAQAKLTSTL